MISQETSETSKRLSQVPMPYQFLATFFDSSFGLLHDPIAGRFFDFRLVVPTFQAAWKTIAALLTCSTIFLAMTAFQFCWSPCTEYALTLSSTMKTLYALRLSDA